MHFVMLTTGWIFQTTDSLGFLGQLSTPQNGILFYGEPNEPGYIQRKVKDFSVNGEQVVAYWKE